MKIHSPNPLTSRLAWPRVRPYLAALALATGLSGAQNAGAVVTFQFNYKDAAGVGFNDPAHPEYKASLEAAAQITGSYFAHTATVVMTVTSSNDANSSTLASAGSSFVFPSEGGGFLQYVVQTKVITNGATDANGADDDGTVDVNFGQSFQYDANSPTAPGKIDFRATMIHELTHALGFSSLISQTPTVGPKYYSTFDSFLTDATGAPLIDKTTFAFDQSKTFTLTGGNSTLMDSPSATGEYFSGPTAIARFDNKRIPIFSPSPYKGGSSGSHVDDNTRATKFYLMASAVEAASTSMGMNMPRTYTTAEEGIMKDLGYTLASDHALFFTGEVGLQNKVYYLTFANNNNIFGYYSYLSDPRYIYHFDLGYEYWFEANDGKNGVYFYDFKSGHFFYTSPTFPFPYLYDFTLGTTLYYYPDPTNPQRYNTNGVRYFYNFKSGAIFTQ